MASQSPDTLELLARELIQITSLKTALLRCASGKQDSHS
jgi:hypothetical protein